MQMNSGNETTQSTVHAMKQQLTIVIHNELEGDETYDAWT
jgi:hypothetical protein